MRGGRAGKKALAFVPLVAGLLACDEQASVFVSLGPDTYSAVVLARTVSGEVNGIALDGAVDWTPPGASTAEPIELVVLEYNQTLLDIELPKGTFEPTSDPNGRTLGAPASWKTAQVVDGVLQPWTPSTGPLPDWLSALRFSLPLPTPCFQFSRAEIEVPGSQEAGRISVSVPLDGQHVLIGLEGQTFFDVSPEGVVELPQLATSTRALGGHRLPSGEIWMVMTNGTVRHGTLESGFVDGPAFEEPIQARGELSGPTEPGVPEPDLFFGTRDGSLYRLSEGRWQKVARLDVVSETNWTRVAWVGPGAALVSSNFAQPAVLHYHDGMPDLVDAPTTVFSASYLPSYGPVIGTERGGLYALEDGEWGPVFEADFARIYAMAEVPDGILVSGGLGLARLYFPDRGIACEPETLRGAEVDRILPVEGGFALIPKFGGSDSDSAVTFFLYPG